MRENLHTPGPWEWGEGWRTADFSDDGDKYADLRLRAGSKDLLGLRIDHHEPMWDTADPREDLSDADRALIAAAPDLYEALKEVRTLFLHRFVCPFGISLTSGCACNFHAAAEAVRTALTKAEG